MSWARPRKAWTSLRLGHAQSSIRTRTVVRRLSQIRGGAKKYVGPISLRSDSTVAALSGQFAAKPVTMDWAYENTWSPTQAIGRYDRISSSAPTFSNFPALSAVRIKLRCDSIAPLG